jgi:hypothetical protein
MAIGDVRLQDPSEPQAPNDTTPPTQDREQDQEAMTQRGDEDDGDHQESRSKPPHPRVHQIVQRDHIVDNILGDIKNEVTTRSCIANFYQHYSLFSSMEPFNVEDALHDLDCVVVMQEELNNFKRNQVWSLVKRPKQNIIDTKWAFHNKQDEYEIITRNKVRLVAKGYSQVEGLNFDETFSSIARLESIRILIAYATHHDFKLYQMDIKSVFLNELIKEEVYMEQPPGFGDEEYTNHVYKFYKVLYGLKQAPRV